MKIIKLILIGIFLLGIAFLSNIVPNVNGNELDYTFGFNRGDGGTSCLNSLSAYFPMNYSPGTYYFAPLGYNGSQGGGTLIVYPYNVTVNYSVTFNGDDTNSGSQYAAYFRISSCDANGNVRVPGDLVYYDNNSGLGTSGSFILNANEGCYVELNTGKWWHHVGLFGTEEDGYICNYTISYDLDNLKPLAPTGFTIHDNQDGGLYKSGNIEYTKYNPIVLTWYPGVDPSDANNPSSGVKGYYLYYNNKSYWIDQSTTYYNDSVNQLFVN